MNKTKRPLHLKFYAHTMLLIGLLLSSLYLTTQPVYAADPGCYQESTGGIFTPVQCSSEGEARAVSDFDACFVGGQERNCANLQEPGSAVPDSTSFSSSSGSTTLKTDCETGRDEELSQDNCAIIEYLVVGINILSALAGMAIVASIMIAGYQYMTARDNANVIQQARTRIIWAITALLLFIFMYALLNFLVPGGVL